jgi:hypothetical protein
MNIFFLCRVTQDIGSCRPSPGKQHAYTLISPTGRFRFSGGTNVTLEGSTDPHWGWVDAHGQQVNSTMPIACKCVLTRNPLVVGRYASKIFTGEPPSRVVFWCCHNWGGQVYEIIAGEYWARALT